MTSMKDVYASCHPSTLCVSLNDGVLTREVCVASQGSVGKRPLGHHSYGARVDEEPDEPVRSLPPSTLHVSLNDGGTNLGVGWWWWCRWLSSNDLTDAIPTEMGMLTSLALVYASFTLHVALNDGVC